MNKKHIGTALVGYGYGGKTFHAPLIDGVSELSLNVVVSSDAEKVHQDLPAVRVSRTLEEAISSSEFELVVIATPNDTHFELAKAALAAGKHVVVDKPFTTTCAEATELIELAQRCERVLSVFHNRRWDADFITVKQLLENGRLGDIVHFESHFDRFRPQVRQRWREQVGAGTGIWFDLGSHLLDQCIQLFGKPQALQVDLEMQREGASAVDYFHAVLHYGRMRAILHASALVAGESARFTIHGTKGSYVKYGLDTQEDALKRGDDVNGDPFGCDPRAGDLTVYIDEKPHVASVSTSKGDYLFYYRAVANAIADRNARNPVPAEDALLVMQLLETGCKSSEEKRLIAIE